MTQARWMLVTLALFIVGLASNYGWYCHRERLKDAARIEAAEQAGRMTALTDHALKVQAAADSFAVEASKANAEKLALKAKLASVLKSSPTVGVGDTQPGPVNSATAPAPISADDLRDQIITAQDTQIAALNGEVGELRTEISLKDQVIQASTSQTAALESVIDHTAKDRPWTAGVLYRQGLNGVRKVGAFVGRSFGVVHVQANVFNDSAALGVGISW